MAGRSENTKLKNEIIETARWFFKTKGFEQTTVRDITERLDINDQIVFDYFASLDEILEVVWSESYKVLQ